jgi:hypothetical protein
MFSEIERVEILMRDEMNERLAINDVVVVVRVRIARTLQPPLLKSGGPREQEISGQEKPAALEKRPGQAGIFYRRGGIECMSP